MPPTPPRPTGGPMGHAIHTVQRRDGKRLAVRLGLAALVVVMTATIGTLAWFSYSINAPVGGATPLGGGEPSVVVIPTGSSISEISQILSQKGLIRSSTAFEIYARIGPAHGQLKPGPYQLNPGMSTVQILDYLSSGKIAVRTFVARDGLTLAQLAASYEQQGFGAASEFTAAVGAAKLSPSAQAFFGSPTSLEGLLPADSYQLIINDPASALIAQMLKNLDEKVIPAFQTVSSYPGKLTAYQVLILASIVEKEASTPADRSGVAGVFYNRLAKGIKLESDVTVIYITGRTEPTATDLNSNSPYNTRKFAGLPPTPISVPSLAAIESTLKPTASSYIFFIGGKDGKTYYANTYAEHLINIDKYM